MCIRDRNHQFIGVNKGYDAFLGRETRGGRLGVFWHTQGSGKSFAMIFYARKILRKCPGNFSFVVVTDREDLDGQIYRNFLNTGTVRKADTAQPKDGEQMRAFLGQNKRLVFTLIQKFHWPKGKHYPLLSDRDDIIVMVDAAHRTQYRSLARTMLSISHARPLPRPAQALGYLPLCRPPERPLSPLAQRPGAWALHPAVRGRARAVVGSRGAGARAAAPGRRAADRRPPQPGWGWDEP